MTKLPTKRSPRVFGSVKLWDNEDLCVRRGYGSELEAASTYACNLESHALNFWISRISKLAIFVISELSGEQKYGSTVKFSHTSLSWRQGLGWDQGPKVRDPADLQESRGSLNLFDRR